MHPQIAQQSEPPNVRTIVRTPCPTWSRRTVGRRCKRFSLCFVHGTTTIPNLNPPGTLKEAKDFNAGVYLDGFDWKSSSGFQGYVVHLIDEATQFHLGRRTVQDGALAQKVVENCWSSWAGSPGEFVLDCGGEFVSGGWKTSLQQESVRRNHERNVL